MSIFLALLLFAATDVHKSTSDKTDPGSATPNSGARLICVDAQTHQRCINSSLPQFLGFPGNPDQQARASIRLGDIRLAGWGRYTAPSKDGSVKLIVTPYGLNCTNLDSAQFRYIYIISDAITKDAFDDYRYQKYFMSRYNSIIYKSGRLPAQWLCKLSNTRGR